MDARVGRFTGRDAAAGEDEHPITWHRYAYGGDNPIANTDPSGLFFLKSNPIYGMKVHYEVGMDFKNFYGMCGEADLSIGKLLGVTNLLRPDLVNICSHEVYEIKPITSYYRGAIQLLNYVAIIPVI